MDLVNIEFFDKELARNIAKIFVIILLGFVSFDFLKRSYKGLLKKETWIYCSTSRADKIHKRGVGTSFCFCWDFLPETIVYGKEAQGWGIIYLIISIPLLVLTFILIIFFSIL